MLQRLRSRLHGEGGFTLIELLVVILIIGILAAIAIPSFLSQKSKGEDASLKSAARSAQTAMETFYTDDGDYTATPAELKTLEPALNDSEFLLYNTASGTAGTVDTSTGGSNNYRVTVVGNPSTGRTFWVDKTATGAVTRGCSVASTASSKGGCSANVPGSGTANGTW